MIRFHFFHRSIGVAKPIEDVLKAFKKVEFDVDSQVINRR